MRSALLIIGLLVLAVAWLGPLPESAEQSFSAHMTLHMAVVAVAAPLLALGIAGLSFDPVRWAPGFFGPIQASIIELIVVWAWHAPVLHLVARNSASGFVLEQATFLASGLFLWLAAFGENESSRSRRAAGVVGLLLTSMHMTLLGALLALSQRPLYYHGEHSAMHASLVDQHLGGVIMLTVGGVSYLAGGLWLMFEVLRDSRLKIGEVS